MAKLFDHTWCSIVLHPLFILRRTVIIPLRVCTPSTTFSSFDVSIDRHGCDNGGGRWVAALLPARCPALDQRPYIRAIRRTIHTYGKWRPSSRRRTISRSSFVNRARIRGNYDERGKAVTPPFERRRRWQCRISTRRSLPSR